MPEILVVGAGPTGLALACGLRLHGVGVRVIDKAAAPAVTSRANFVHARGAEVLDRLDALGTLPDEAGRAARITTYLGDKPMMRLRFGDPGLHTAAGPLVVSQAKVEAALRRRLAELGVEPEWGVGLQSADQDDNGVTAALTDGSTVRIGWLVGADGTSSTVRKVAGISAPGVRLSERFLLADAHLDIDLDRTGTSGWISPAGMLGLMPMPDPDEGGVQGRGDLWRVFAYDPDGEAERRLSPDEVLTRITEILPERTGRAVTVRDAVWLSDFTIHRRLAGHYRAGRMLIAGDAAHAHAPFGGQGMLTGLGDAENLAWKLALVVEGTADAALLDTYEAERRPLATDVLRGTSAVTRIDVARSPLARFLRDRVLIRAFSAGWVQRLATRTASQLWVSYRKGPLGAGLAGQLRGRPHPGDRVDSRDCTRPDGAATRLNAELGGRWALLVPARGARPATPPNADPAVTAAVAALGEHVVVLRHVPDGGPDTDELWLVRPDGHLAWRGTDLAGASTWLRAALGTGRRPGARASGDRPGRWPRPAPRPRAGDESGGRAWSRR